MSNQDMLVMAPPHIDISSMLVGKSQAIQHVRQLVLQAAKCDVNVLILGESGTGKEVVAKCLHMHSKRSEHNFIPVNCGAIPGELLESELFGHEKGAFTGAYIARKGRFEQAEKGTIFLDEIGDMPLTMQVKLLRVVQERLFERIGSNKSLEADVRIVAATHCMLEKAIEENKFREDLYYRLNVFPIDMPPLRQRIEDLPLLIDDLMSQFAKKHACQIAFTENAIDTLSDYQWPGNIRELGNLIERLMVLYPNTMIDIEQLPLKYRACDLSGLAQDKKHPLQVEQRFNMHFPFSDQGIDLKKYLVDIELSCIKHALEQCDGVVVRAAKLLSMRRTTLVEKMRKYRISRTDVTLMEEAFCD